MFVSVRDVGSISCKIGQKIEDCRLMQRCTQAELASKIGLAYQEINNYENGYSAIPVEVLYIIAKADLTQKKWRERKEFFRVK